MTFTLRIQAFLFLLAIALLPATLPGASWAAPLHPSNPIAKYADFAECEAELSSLAPVYPETYGVVQMALDFAKKHDLPVKIVEVGPPERRVQRLFVGLDFWNYDTYLDYLKTFNLENTPDQYKEFGVSGVLDIAAAYEPHNTGKEEYVSVVVRPRANPEAPIWKWGREYGPREHWWEHDFLHPEARERPIIGYSHLIGMNEADKVNVWKYLYNPEERGPCKSDNCVAWVSSIETGRTSKDATDAERRALFGELGVSRTIAHFEIARRLMHAASERHSVVFVYLQGEEGRKAFQTNLIENLPPDPKKPFNQIVQDVEIKLPDDLVKASELIPDGARVFMPIATGASPDGLLGLVNRAQGLEKGVTLVTLVNGLSEATLTKAMAPTNGKVKLEALFLGGNMRKLHREGKVTLIEGVLGDHARGMQAAGDPHSEIGKRYRYDTIIVRVSPPDSEGRYSLGPNHDTVMTIIRNQPWVKVIAEVNPNVPFTNGDNFLRRNQIHAMFSSKTTLDGPPVVPQTAVETQLAEHLSTLVGNGSTIQVGIGNVFGGLPSALEKRGVRGLKIFTEMMGDSLMKVIQKGIADHAETGFLYGTKNLYQWADHNPKVRMVATEYVNDAAKVAQIPHFTAINTALQVDLHGNANATHGPNNNRISSPGGQPEFMYGGAHAPSGKAIIAIRSTAKNGTLSTIVLDCYSEQYTTPAENVTHVVTEYGVAELKGKDKAGRAMALVKVAHPDFRAKLIRDGIERGFFNAQQIQADPELSGLLHP